jgi:hypothetical protein
MPSYIKTMNLTSIVTANPVVALRIHGRAIGSAWQIGHVDKQAFIAQLP